MKKYSKMITLLLVLAMVFTLFTGFTYAPVDVDNLAIVECPMCYGNGRCNIGICDGTSSCTADSCGACDGTHICPECKGTGTVEGATNPTPKPTTTPNPTKCTVSGIMHINDEAYEIDVNNYVGDNFKLEFLATSSKGHTLTYTWKNNDVTIAGANTNIYTAISNVLGNHKYLVMATCATCSVNSSNHTNVNTIAKPVVSPSPTTPPTVTEQFKVTFAKFNNGWWLFDSTTTLETKQFKSGQAVGIEHDFIGSNFSHYSTDKEGLNKVSNDYIITKDVTLYVNYNVVADVKIKYCVPQSYTDDGIRSYSIYKTVTVKGTSSFEPLFYDKQLKTLNKFYNFKEWTFDKDGKEKVPENYIVTENITLYAQYTTEPVAEKTALSQLWDYLVQFVGWVITTVVSVLNWIFALFS